MTTSVKTCKQVVVSEYGPAKKLSLQEVPITPPGPEEVRVRIQATGIAFADILMRYGVYPGTPKPPFVPGYDIAGVVETVGSAVSEISPGDQVVALTVRGGYAESISLPASELVVAPKGCDPAELVSLVLNYVTAFQRMRRKACVNQHGTVLIHGAGGGVGTALLQIGQQLNLKMFATVSESKSELVESLGGIPIDYQKEDFVKYLRKAAPNGVDAVFDGVGGLNYLRSYRCLSFGGTLVSYGATTAVKANSGSLPQLAGSALLASALGWWPDGRKTFFYSMEAEKKRDPAAFKEDLGWLVENLSTNKLKPIICARFALDDAAKAQALLESGKSYGKIVIVQDI